VLKGPVQVGIRRATAADARRLAVFAADAFRATYGPAADPACGGGSRAADVEAYVGAHFGEAHQCAELGDPALVTLVGEVGPSAAGPLAAYAQLVRPRAPLDTAELVRLYVQRQWQGSGLAAALLGAVADAARADGAGRLQLAVYQRNARAVAFYRRHGFAVTGTATFQMGAERQDDWLMVLALS
jgi:GNAT superfamily N-acetyltransferase